MNHFGTLFRVAIFGESHGVQAGILLDGIPAGIPLEVADFLPDLERRKSGAKGTTPRKEDDLPELMNGWFNGYTTGAPLLIRFANNNTRSSDYEKQRAIPRPGHADFVAREKFGGYEDYRGGGHFSGRLTVCLVAAGVVARKVLRQWAPQLHIEAHITHIGGYTKPEEGLEYAIQQKDSIGGEIECTASGVPLGWGEPFFGSVESVISQGIFSIPAVKGIEFGAGFAATRMLGSVHNDALLNTSGATRTNHAGGIVGGITNGNNLVFRVAFKPTSSTPKEQQTLNLETGEVDAFSVKGRHDLCIALRAPVVVEAVTAIALADLCMQAQVQRTAAPIASGAGTIG